MEELVQQLVCVRGSKPCDVCSPCARPSSGSAALISPAGGDGEETRPPSFQLSSNDEGSRRWGARWFSARLLRGKVRSERTQSKCC